MVSKTTAIAFGSGFLFALGLGISGMTQPQKVLGFLDLSNWDPSLMFVMVGAIGVHVWAYRAMARRPTPLLAKAFEMPRNRDLTPRLLLGSAIFGAGWGLGGYCPGPAVTALASGTTGPVIFVGAMLVGMFISSFATKADGSTA